MQASDIKASTQLKMEFNDLVTACRLTIEKALYGTGIFFYFQRINQPTGGMKCSLSGAEADVLLVALAEARGKKVVSAEFYEQAKAVLADPAASSDASADAPPSHHLGDDQRASSRAC